MNFINNHTNAVLKTDIISSKKSAPSTTKDNNAKVNNDNEEDQIEDAATIGLEGYLDEVEDFESALDILNSEGIKQGVSFKRGNTHYYADRSFRDKRAICSHAFRNKPKNKSAKSDAKKESLNTVKNFNNNDEIDQCPVYYKLAYERDTQIMTFDEAEEVHNYQPGLDDEKVSELLMKEVSSFSKNAKIIEIKEALERKYKKQIDYNSVYRAFRKIYPRLGPDDGNYIKQILEKLNLVHKFYLNEDIIHRLLLTTPRMLKNYELYGRIMLIDSTYRCNHYNIPLIVYSGINSAGKNILFGLAIVCDEKEETQAWCLNEFFSIHKNKHPDICLTDQDLSLVAVLNNNYPNIVHLLCQWHLKQKSSETSSVFKKYEIV